MVGKRGFRGTTFKEASLWNQLTKPFTFSVGPLSNCYICRWVIQFLISVYSKQIAALIFSTPEL